MKRVTPTPIQALRLKQQTKTQKKPAKRSGLPRSSSLRSKQRRQYSKESKAYLLVHPFCQVQIFFLKLDEAKAIERGGTYLKKRGMYPPSTMHLRRSNQCHHRNKCDHERLINFEYIMAASAEGHHWIENNLKEARALGLLCPINCKPDGTMPDGTKQPTTTELLASRHAEK